MNGTNQLIGIQVLSCKHDLVFNRVHWLAMCFFYLFFLAKSVEIYHSLHLPISHYLVNTVGQSTRIAHTALYTNHSVMSLL